MRFSFSAFLLVALLQSVLASLPASHPLVHTSDQAVLANDSLYISMRDGVRLWTVIHLPSGGEPVGCVLERTPYSTAGSGSSSRFWLDLGFAFVMQDQRGSSISRDDYFQFWRSDGMDGYDTMEWIASQSWSNGKVFLTGTSASGNAVVAGMLESPPWLKGIYAIVYTANGHPTSYQGGAFRQALVQNWLLVLLFTQTLQDVKENEPYSEWWDPITLPGKENLCNVPGVTSAGWFDIFQNESIEAFNACQYVSNSPGARGQHKIVVDPHGHCGGGEYSWPNGRISLSEDLAAEIFLTQNGMEVPASLQSKVADVEAITIYVMGPEDAAVGNYWSTIPHWPSFTSTNYYLHQGGSLATTPSTATNSSTTYTYNPRDPVGTIGGHELFIACGPRDQAELESRQDVVVFTAPPFKADVAIVGNLSAVLYVSSDAVDTDFTVKITDVYPDGRSMLLADGIVRMRWRESKEVPTWVEKGVVYEIKVDLWKTAYVFNSGHALRVAVSSSNDPRFEKNLNNGKLVAEGGTAVVAENSIYYDASHPSRITLPVIALSDVPENYFP